MKQFYVERKASGYVGNCMLWWRKGNNGYTCNLSDARVFDGNTSEFRSLMTGSHKYRAWEKDYADSCACLHVDHQRVNIDMGITRETMRGGEPDA